MRKSKGFRAVITVILLLLLGFACLSCDPSIYDFADGELPGGSNLLDDLNFRDLLDAEDCYNKLLKDLEYMRDDCVSDKKLAEMQSYTILLSYGMADMAKETKTFTYGESLIKAELYNSIKMINVYSGNIGGVIDMYDQGLVSHYTDRAINQCSQIIDILTATKPVPATGI